MIIFLKRREITLCPFVEKDHLLFYLDFNGRFGLRHIRYVT